MKPYSLYSANKLLSVSITAETNERRGAPPVKFSVHRRKCKESRFHMKHTAFPDEKAWKLPSPVKRRCMNPSNY